MIKKLGDGNFTQVFQVIHKKFPKGQNYALKICEIQKVENMRRENDILLEKHSLNKIREKYAKEMELFIQKLKLHLLNKLKMQQTKTKKDQKSKLRECHLEIEK